MLHWLIHWLIDYWFWHLVSEQKSITSTQKTCKTLSTFSDYDFFLDFRILIDWLVHRYWMITWFDEYDWCNWLYRLIDRFWHLVFRIDFFTSFLGTWRTHVEKSFSPWTFLWFLIDWLTDCFEQWTWVTHGWVGSEKNIFFNDSIYILNNLPLK